MDSKIFKAIPAAFVEIGYILVFSDVLQSMLLPHAAQCAQGAHCLLAGGALFGGFRRFGLGLFRHGGRFFFGFRLLRLFPRGKRHGRAIGVAEGGVSSGRGASAGRTMGEEKMAPGTSVSAGPV